ncbi:MAG: hypothetical protein R3C52_06570 [Hyphomonadaceae bacterium]
MIGLLEALNGSFANWGGRVRLVASFILVLASVWLLFLTVEPVWGGPLEGAIGRLGEAADSPAFMAPLFGGLCGLLGGIVLLYGGIGGSAAGILGGGAALGYALYAGHTVPNTLTALARSDLVVGGVIAAFALIAAFSGRGDD